MAVRLGWVEFLRKATCDGFYRLSKPVKAVFRFCRAPQGGHTKSDESETEDEYQQCQAALITWLDDGALVRLCPQVRPGQREASCKHEHLLDDLLGRLARRPHGVLGGGVLNRSKRRLEDTLEDREDGPSIRGRTPR